MPKTDFTYAEMETAYGKIAGVDFGSQVRILARSPSHVLFNAMGCRLWDRSDQGYHGITSLFEERASKGRIGAVVPKIDEVFGEGVGAAVLRAWSHDMTIIVDGGGGVLVRPRKVLAMLAKAEYAELSPDWRANLKGRIKTCRQCGADLKPRTAVHHLRTRGKPRDDHPKNVAGCQLLSNYEVVATHGFGPGNKTFYGYVNSFETWDGVSLEDDHFCSNMCAADYGRRAAAELPALKPGVAAPSSKREPKEIIAHGEEPEPRTLNGFKV